MMRLKTLVAAAFVLASLGLSSASAAPAPVPVPPPTPPPPYKLKVGESSNYAGYITTQEATYHEVSARWTQPELVQKDSHLGSDYQTAFWVGLGGGKGRQGDTIVQCGTVMGIDRAGGRHYAAVWQMFPVRREQLKEDAYPVQPGDVVNAHVNFRQDGKFHMSLTTNRWQWSKDFDANYMGHNYQRDTAEVITERPENSVLTPFGTVNFSLVQIGWEKPGGAWAIPYTMVDDQGRPLVTTSRVSSDGRSFSTTYVGPK